MDPAWIGHRRSASLPAPAVYAARVKTRLICPCGTQVDGRDEDELVARTQEHLAAEHPGREYDRDMILFMAT